MRVTFSHLSEVNLCPAFFSAIVSLMEDYANVSELLTIEPFLDACEVSGRLPPCVCVKLAPILRTIINRFSSQHEYHKMAALRIADGLEQAARSQENFQFGG
jgi:hypothetical protein